MGADRGGRPATLAPAGGPTVATQVLDPLLEAYGRWPSADNPKGPKPNVIPGQPNYNPYLGAWIE